MWFFETGVTHLLGRKYQNRCWVGITATWYTFSIFTLGLNFRTFIKALFGSHIM